MATRKKTPRVTKKPATPKRGRAPKAPRTGPVSTAKTGLSFDDVRALALALPGTEESTSYGTPAFKVRKKLIARLREEGDVLVVKVDPMARDVLMRGEPETFFITDHYAGYPEYLLVRLPKVRPQVLAKLLEEAWSQVASRQQLEERAKGRR